jgi:hypothetical protein
MICSIDLSVVCDTCLNLCDKFSHQQEQLCCAHRMSRMVCPNWSEKLIRFLERKVTKTIKYIFECCKYMSSYFQTL